MKKVTLLLMAFSAIAAAGCEKKIGDACSYDVNCSVNMDRNCDHSQPSGYCLILGCDPDGCPSEAACIEFTTPCPEPLADAGVDGGEGDYYDDMCEQIEPNRGRTYCLRACSTDDDCRSGYMCAAPADLSARIIDLETSDPDEGVCVPDA